MLLLALASTLVLLALLLFLASSHNAQIPGALHLPTFPLVGHAFLVQNNPARQFMAWARKYQRPSFVIRLGTRPVLVVNSHSQVSELWLRHSQATGSRPLFHTFHNVVSATQGFTVGLTPAGASCQRKKKCIGKQLSRRYVDSQWGCRIVDLHSRMFIQHHLRKSVSSSYYSRTPHDDVSLLRPAQYFVLGCALHYTYGFRLHPYGPHSSLADTVADTENTIIRLRSPLANYQDYIPGGKCLAWLFLPTAQMAAKSRDIYMGQFMKQFEVDFARGSESAMSCLLGRVYLDPTSSLTSSEIASLCLSMVSAGLDNIALNYDHLIGHLARPPEGYKMQERLFRELLSIYGDLGTAWRKVATEQASVYALALIHETMRYFTVLPLSLPRETTKDVVFAGMTIPKGTMLLMNAYAANHDWKVFQNPYSFFPDRWIDENYNIVPESTLRHFAFGAGSRKCTGVALALKELYVLLCRTVLTFQVRRPVDPNKQMIMDPFEANLCPSATSFEPKEFKVWLRRRHHPGSLELRHEILFG
uniref:Cytochrome P450 n=1 Tax=Candidozyma auris TaxID=498019 RepID=A0A0L0NTW9_CANAR